LLLRVATESAKEEWLWRAKKGRRGKPHRRELQESTGSLRSCNSGPGEQGSSKGEKLWSPTDCKRAARPKKSAVAGCGEKGRRARASREVRLFEGRKTLKEKIPRTLGSEKWLRGFWRSKPLRG
jgi:hypothetical protein